MLPASTPLIEARGVTKNYALADIETRAVDAVDVALHSGDYAVVTGPSGCGKSSLLRLLALLEAPDGGDILVSGQPASHLSDEAAARLRNTVLGVVFQNFLLIPDLTVAQNVELPLTFRRDISAADRRARTHACLEAVGLGSRAGHYPHTISGGQQQRAAIARALVTEPAVLLADEPTGNLDSANGDAVIALLKQIHAKGTAVLMVTHDPRYAEEGNRAIEMLDGRILSDRRRQQ